MRNLILIATIFFALVIVSCGNKKESTEEIGDADGGIVDETLDTTTAYENVISDGFTDESGIIDSSKKDQMVYTDASKEVLIDPPVDASKEKVVPVKKEEVAPIKSETKIDKPIEKSHEKRFYVVAGSFKKYSNAENLFDLFKKKGYEPLILPKANGYNRVALVSYSQEKEARKALSKVRSENNDITFWLYKW